MTDTSPEAVERLRAEVMTLEHLGGTWVTAEDYLALAARLKEVERENEELRFIKAIGLEWKARADSAEAELAAMRSEGSWYKEADIDALQNRAEAAEAAREGLWIQARLLTAGTCGVRGRVVGERILALIEKTSTKEKL